MLHGRSARELLLWLQYSTVWLASVELLLLPLLLYSYFYAFYFYLCPLPSRSLLSLAP